jgi:hypothetical protein
MGCLFPKTKADMPRTFDSTLQGTTFAQAYSRRTVTSIQTYTRPTQSAAICVKGKVTTGYSQSDHAARTSTSNTQIEPKSLAPNSSILPIAFYPCRQPVSGQLVL